MWTEVLVAVAVALVILVRYCRNGSKAGEEIPGTKSSCLRFNIMGLHYLWRNRNVIPPLSNVLHSTLGTSKIFQKEGVFQFWIGPRILIAVYKPEYMEEITDGKKFPIKTDLYKYLKEFLKNGLILSSGTKWKSRRKMITPVFHFRVFEGYQDIVNSHTGLLVDHLRVQGSGWLDINPVMSRCLLDAIGAAAFGIEMNALNGDSEYLAHLKKVLTLAMKRMVNPLVSNGWIFSLTKSGREYYNSATYLTNFTLDLIKKRKKEMLDKLEKGEELNEGKKPKSFLNLLVEEHIRNNSLSIYDIEEEVQTFLFAGHDTTATGNSWTLYHLGRHPDILKKVQEEVDSILDDDRPITAEDLKSMKYLEMVIKESNRITPPIPLIGRTISQDTTLGKYKLPKGGTLLLWIYHLHHNSDIYPDPEKFDPERFRPGSPQLLSRHPYAFIPFSAGPRNCIGQKLAMIEQKTLVATIVKHFDVEARDPFDTLLLSLDVVLSSVQPLMLRFTPRSSQ